MQHSTKAELNAAGRTAKNDADAIEAVALGKPSAQGEHARREGQILDRLRSPKYAAPIGEAWMRIKRYQRNGDEGQRVIKRLLRAFTLSEQVRLLRDDYQYSMKRLEELKSFADQLHKYFTDTVERDPTWKVVGGNYLRKPRRFSRQIYSLRRIQLYLTNRMAESARAFDQLGLTREDKALVAPRVTFTGEMSAAIRDIFGRPLDDVVRNLVRVVFETEDVTVNQVKKARKTAERRRGRTQAPKI